MNHPPTSPQSCTTFDVFDTLIARRYFGAASIFKLLEIKNKISDFAIKRMEAESLVRQSTPDHFNLLDIYEKLAELIPLNEYDLNLLCEQEIAEELLNCIPISENIALVKDDSILISDMYLTKDIVETLLESVGFCKERMPFILLSNCGKSDGTVWSGLKELNITCHHLGDNYISDIRNAGLENMDSFITRIAMPTFFEDNLVRKGLVNLAVAIREARLRTNHIFSQPDAGTDIKLLQANFNMPFLLRTAAFVITSCLDGSSTSKTLLFASRGSKFLHELTRLLLPHIEKSNSISTHYWLSSRQVNLSSSENYINYTLSLVSGQPILVDLNGSGVSLRNFLNHLEKSRENKLDGQIILGYHCPNSLGFARSKYSSEDPSLIDGRPFSSVSNSNFKITKCLLECLNFSPEGRLLDMDLCMGQYVPRRDAYEFSSPVRQLIEDQQNYALVFIKNLVDTMQFHSVGDLISDTLSEPYLQALGESFAYHECLIQSLYNKFYAHGDLTNEVQYDKALANGFQNPYHI